MSAKELRVEPISSQDARALCRILHYSGKVVAGSQLHFGVFWRGRLEGVMQFGPPMDRRKLIGLVRCTKWNGFLELNRMAFSDRLPRNSESRALAVAMMLIRKHYPHIEWIVSFADATQCGDGTIYRAAGFVLTAIKKNKTILQLPKDAAITDPAERKRLGTIVADKTLNDHPVYNTGFWKRHGAKALDGYQLRYVYFVNRAARARLTCREIPFSEIGSAGMYRGTKRAKQAMADLPVGTAAEQHRPARSISEAT